MKKLFALLFLIPFTASSLILSSAQVSRYFAEQGNSAKPLSPMEWLAKEQKDKPSVPVPPRQTNRPPVDVRALAVDPSEYLLLQGNGLLGANNAVAARVSTLSGSGVSSSVTSIGLSSFKVPGADTKLAMTDFGDLGCGTIEPGNSARQEFVSFTGITQNSDGTATLTGAIRGLSPVSPYTASTTQQRAHAGGSQFVISNSPPCFYENYANRTASTTISSRWFFAQHPEASPELAVASTSRQYATKQYVDNTNNSGISTSTETQFGGVELATEVEVASSTPSTSNQALVIQAQNATSTPTYGCNDLSTVGALCIPVAENDGKLSQSWIDLTENYAWTTGNQRFNNGATTTSLAASSTAANPLKLNTLSYAHPSSLPQQATSTLYVTATTTGDVINLGWRFPDGGQLASTSLNSAASTLYATVTPHAFYDVNILTAGTSGNCTTRLIFNNDRGNNYAYQVESNGGAGTPVNGDGYIPIANQSTTSPVRLKIHIQNLAGFAKGVFSDALFTPDTGVASLGIAQRTSGIWANTTTTISTIGIYGSGCNFTAGTMMEIKGSSD